MTFPISLEDERERLKVAEDYRLRLIAIDGLQSHARWLAQSSERLVHYMTLLVTRPDYPTRASEEFKEAITRVAAALETLKDMAARYAEKPLDK